AELIQDGFRSHAVFRQRLVQQGSTLFWSHRLEDGSSVDAAEVVANDIEGSAAKAGERCLVQVGRDRQNLLLLGREEHAELVVSAHDRSPLRCCVQLNRLAPY